MLCLAIPCLLVKRDSLQVGKGRATTGGPSYGGGFTSTGLTLNGNAAINGTSLRLTDGGSKEAGSGLYNTLVNVQSFTKDFSFQLTNPCADGIHLHHSRQQSIRPGACWWGRGAWPDTGVQQNPSARENAQQVKKIAHNFEICNAFGSPSDPYSTENKSLIQEWMFSFLEIGLLEQVESRWLKSQKRGLDVH